MHGLSYTMALFSCYIFFCLMIINLWRDPFSDISSILVHANLTNIMITDLMLVTSQVALLGCLPCPPITHTRHCPLQGSFQSLICLHAASKVSRAKTRRRAVAGRFITRSGLLAPSDPAGTASLSPTAPDYWLMHFIIHYKPAFFFYLSLPPLHFTINCYTQSISAAGFI